MKHRHAWSLVIALAACGDDSAGGTADAGTGTEPLRVRWERLGDDGPTPRPEPYLGTLDGKLVMFGGRDATNQFLGDTWIWDGAWTQLAPATSPLPRANGVLIEQDGRLVMVGGVGRDEDGRIAVFGDAWTFDGATWAPLAGEVPGRQGAAGAEVDGHAVVVGGSGDTPELADAWSLAPGATTWTELPMDPLPRRAAAMTTVGAAGYLTGGSTPGASADVSRFDGTTWSTAGELPRGGRAYHGAGTLADRVVVFGGVITSTEPIGVTDGWPYGVEVVGDEPEPRSAPRMVTLGDAVMMWGGVTAAGATSELWRLERAP
jgi:hypothetical protein